MKHIKLIIILLLSSISVFSQEDKVQWDADEISNTTVFLSQPISPNLAISGSATLLKFKTFYFLLTANHVAKELKLDSKILFRQSGDKPLIIDLLKIVKDGKLSWNSHPEADIAIIEIVPYNDTLKNYFKVWSFPINQILNSKEMINRDANITFLGYPVFDLKMEHFSPFVFDARISSGLMTQPRYDTGTLCNFYYLSEPSIQGCSGSGVYYSIKKGMFLGGDKTILIGVVHGTQGDNTGGKLAAITPSYYIFDLFK